ncbi:MAG TPA: STM4015 family protein [Ktedonobacteraceae bacterium]|nr:STM4015 family protein [Ktedonobacteraceae bacterium]
MLEYQENLAELAGKRVIDWNPEEGLQNVAETIYRVRGGYGEEETWPERFAAFLQDPAVNELTGLVVGMWSTEVMETGEAEAMVEALVAARAKLPKLRALFLGDIIREENEVSWIAQTDVSPLLEAYPELDYFGVRGGSGLHFGDIRHRQLRSLVVEAGGLAREVVLDILRADLPALEHLELWLGSAQYGGNTTVEDLAPLLRNDLFPHLRYLGLRDSEIVDEIAAVMAYAPIVERIETLDLSLGTLTDTGAQALLQSPLIPGLKKLDLHHHYCSDAMIQRLWQLPIEVDVRDAQTPDVYDWDGREMVERYVALAE